MTGLTREVRLALADGAELRVLVAEPPTEAAPPRPVLLVSGLGGTADFWRPAAARLSARRQVVSFDQRGIAGSTRGSAKVSIAQLADDCLAVLDALRVGQADVIGHSTGGAITQHLAVAAPDRCGRIVLSGAWLGPNDYMTRLFKARRQMLEAAPEAYASFTLLLAMPLAHLEQSWPAFDRAVANAPRDREQQRIILERIDALLAFDGRASARLIRQPVLVFGARDDMVVPPHLQVELAAAIPRARHAELEGGGHFFPVSETGRFCDLVETWLDAEPH